MLRQRKGTIQDVNGITWDLTRSTLSVCCLVAVQLSQPYQPPLYKTNKMTLRPAKTQISLGIRPVWSVFVVRMNDHFVLSYPLRALQRRWSGSSLSAWRKLGSLPTHWAQGKTLIRLGGCWGWSESSLGAHAILLGLSWGGLKCVCSWTCHHICAFVLRIVCTRKYEPRHDKTNEVTVRPAKTQISLGIRPVWSESSLCAQWVVKNPSLLHADSEDSDQSLAVPSMGNWGQSDQSLRWAHSHFVGFVMSRLISENNMLDSLRKTGNNY